MRTEGPLRLGTSSHVGKGRRSFLTIVPDGLGFRVGTCLVYPLPGSSARTRPAMENPPYYVYILSNRHRTVLYVGMTNDLQRRLREHREGRKGAFTSRYNVVDLVYFERHSTSTAAIEREKQLKGWRREKKGALIEAKNPDLEALSPPVE